MAATKLLEKQYTAILANEEPLIRLRDVPKLKWLPNRGGGRRLSLTTLFRWVDGLRGVQLETVKVGATLCTSEAAVKRFFERLSEPGATSATNTPSEINRAHAAAEKRLAAAGI